VYQDGLTSTFVSLDIGAGPPTCKEIPIFLNGYFQADENGNWRSSKKFDPNKVMYGVILEGVQVTQKTWSDVVDYACKTYRYRTYSVESFTLTSAYTVLLDNKMKPISDLGGHRDFAWNTVMWTSSNIKFKMSERFSGDGAGKFQFFPEASADVIFQSAEIQTAGWSNSNGPCKNHTTRGFFDIPTKSVILQTDLCSNGFCDDNQVYYFFDLLSFTLNKSSLTLL
jgi:hypothetical protein